MSLRLTGGTLKGRVLKTPEKSPMRPTRSRVRETVFNLLLGVVDWDGIFVADICSGTGAYGIESLSRGAAKALFVDIQPRWTMENLTALKLLEQAEVKQLDLRRLKLGEQRPDVIFLDPPYGLGLVENALARAADIGKTDSLWVIETPPAEAAMLAVRAGFSVLKQRQYGESTITLLVQQSG